jgi:hypothetical protein
VKHETLTCVVLLIALVDFLLHPRTSHTSASIGSLLVGQHATKLSFIDYKQISLLHLSLFEEGHHNMDWTDDSYYFSSKTIKTFLFFSTNESNISTFVGRVNYN